MKKNPLALRAAMAATALMLSACATTPGAGADPRDPFENYNRNMFTFNQKLDENVLKPVATSYANHVPSFVSLWNTIQMDVKRYLGANLQLVML